MSGLDELRALGAVLDDLEDAAVSLADRGDVAGIGALLAEVRAVRRALGDRERGIEDVLADAMTEKVMDVPGLGRLERRKGTVRKRWQSDELLSAVIRRGLDPEGTGELPASIPEVVDVIRSEVAATVPITPSLGWRAGALRDRGFDPDEWCESEPGRVTVHITGGNE